MPAKQDVPVNQAELSIDGGLATITLNQPDKHNAFDDAVIQQLLTHLATIRDTPNARVMLLQAAGKHFCAGADLGWMKRMASMSYDDNHADARQLARLMQELNSLPIPTIAKIQGAAYGGAIGLIACCDIAIASDNARFCLSEVKLGLAPATIGPYVVAAIGARQCRRLFLSAEVFNSAQAERYQLVHEVVNIERLETRVGELVQGLLKNGPQACKAAKQLIQNIEDKPADMIEQTSALIAELRVSAEGQEGLAAFFGKRPPNWH